MSNEPADSGPDSAADPGADRPVGPVADGAAETAGAPAAGRPVDPSGPSMSDADTAAIPVVAPAATAGESPRASGAAGVWRAVNRGPQARAWRVVSLVLLILGCVLAPLAVGAGWARNLVVDQQAYLDAVGPLVDDPVILQAAEKRSVTAIDDAVTSLDLADRVSDELTQLGLPPRLVALAGTLAPALRNQLMDGVATIVNRVLNSDEFATAWVSANARAHEGFVKVMQGDTPTADAVSVKLGALLGAVREKLISSGAAWAEQLPEVPVDFQIANNATVQQVQGYYNSLDALGRWLPIAAIALLLLSVLIAPIRLRGLGRAGFWLAVSMVVLALALLLARSYLVNNAPSQPDVTKAFARQLTVNLRDTIRLIGIIGLVVGALAWLFGGSRSATAVRTGVRHLRARVDGSPWGIVARVAAAVVAAVLVLILFALDDPGVILAVVLVVAAGLAGIAAAIPQATVPGAGGPPGGDAATEGGSEPRTEPVAAVPAGSSPPGAGAP